MPCASHPQFRKHSSAGYEYRVPNWHLHAAEPPAPLRTAFPYAQRSCLLPPAWGAASSSSCLPPTGRQTPSFQIPSAPPESCSPLAVPAWQQRTPAANNCWYSVVPLSLHRPYRPVERPPVQCLKFAIDPCHPLPERQSDLLASDFPPRICGIFPALCCRHPPSCLSVKRPACRAELKYLPHPEYCAANNLSGSRSHQ